MFAPQQDLISTAANATAVIDNLLNKIDQIDTLYNGTADYDTLITDLEIATVSSFANAGLTKADLDATIYALKMIAVQARTLNYPAWVMLASIGG